MPPALSGIITLAGLRHKRSAGRHHDSMMALDQNLVGLTLKLIASTSPATDGVSRCDRDGINPILPAEPLDHCAILARWALMFRRRLLQVNEPYGMKGNSIIT
jgi:hypothetical protein